MRVRYIAALACGAFPGLNPSANTWGKKTLLTNRPQCTLITCFPFDHIGPAPRRLIIQANLIDGVATRSR